MNKVWRSDEELMIIETGEVNTYGNNNKKSKLESQIN